MPVDKRDSRVREMFAAISPRYDLLNHLLSLNVDRYWRWRTTRLVPANKIAGPILDLCTGTGDLAISYLRQTDGKVPIIGADFCHEMLIVGNEKMRSHGGGTQVSFVEADAQRLPFSDDCFQLVCVAFGLRNVANTLGGLEEMTRVARSDGGKVAILEFTTPRNRLLRTCYLAYFHRILPFIGETLAPSPSGAYNYLPASVLEFPEPDEVLDLMKKVGLHSVQCRPLTFGIASLYVGTK